RSHGGTQDICPRRPALYRLQQLPHFQILLLSPAARQGYLPIVSRRSLGPVYIQPGFCPLFRLAIVDAGCDRSGIVEPDQRPLLVCRGAAIARTDHGKEKLDPALLRAGDAFIDPEYAKQRTDGRARCAGLRPGGTATLYPVNPLHCFLVLYQDLWWAGIRILSFLS